MNKPLKKIMIEGEWDKSIMYRAACDCGSPEHDLDMEFDKEMGLTILTFYEKVEFFSNYWYNANDSKWDAFRGKIGALKRRLKAIFKLLTGGYLRYESTFIIYGEKQIGDFIEALQYAKEKTKAFKEECEKQGVKFVDL
jgi:hypothetical protein